MGWLLVFRQPVVETQLFGRTAGKAVFGILPPHGKKKIDRRCMSGPNPEQPALRDTRPTIYLLVLLFAK
jgi:hypothetical protein